MTSRGSVLAVVALLLASLPAARAEEPRAPGKVVFSDGSFLAGAIRTTEGKPLRLIEGGTARRLDLAVTEIARLTIRVTHEEEYRVWRWVEDGSREKVFTGETYPKREFETEVTLVNGETRRGSLVAVLYVYEEGSEKPRKVILKDKDQGEVGQTLADRRYVEAVEFATPPAPEGSTGLWLAIDPPELLVAAHAIPRDRLRSVEGARTTGGGSAIFTGLLPGVYDLAVVTERAIFLALSLGAEGEEPLAGKPLEEISARAEEIEDFFTKHEVLAGVKTADRVRAVVCSTREEPTSMGGERTFRRFEIWAFRRGGDRWLVDARFFLCRDHGEALPPPPRIVLAPELAGHRVDKGTIEVRFAVPEEYR
ncbi:MAG: hypothetical protein MUE73_16865 [Planctomycetes bacterium]|nr:hypothetical protein [Planctomycetota bacterium]